MSPVAAPASARSRSVARVLSYTLGASLMAGVLTGCANSPAFQAFDTTVRSGLATLEEGVKKLQEMEMESRKVAGPEGKRITDTPLHNLFAKYPLDGSKPSPAMNGERWWPRVALIPVTVPKEHSAPFGSTPTSQRNGMTVMHMGASWAPHERMCWTYRAKIWYSAKKSVDVPEFLYCMVEAQSMVRVGGAQPTTVFSSFWMSKTQSGSQFTTGPRQPQRVASKKLIESADVHLRTYGYWNMMGIMTAMGIDPYDINEGNRVWFADNNFTQKNF